MESQGLIKSSFRFAHKRHVVIDGVATSFVDVGSGEVIVALHGIPMSSALFAPLLSFLGEYRVITPDL